MKRRLGYTLAGMSTLTLFATVVTGGCGGGGGHGGGGGGGGAGAAAQLVAYLNPSLDGNRGTVKATSITTADLLDSNGSIVKSATINASPNLVVFGLGGLTANTDYFLRINGDGNDVVPARITAITSQHIEEVGTKLVRAIEQTNTQPPITNQDFDFVIFPLGQSSPAVAKYTDGTTESPARYAYNVIDRHTSPLAAEARVLGTGAALIPSYNPTNANHPGAGNLAFAEWVSGGNRHGKAYNGNDAACNGAACHGNLDSHLVPATQFASITVSNGFCYRCHYGKSATAPIDSSQ